LDRKLKDNALKTCIGVLLDLTQQENVLAFSRAAEECKLFPRPATLIEYRGRAAVDNPAHERKDPSLPRHGNGRQPGSKQRDTSRGPATPFDYWICNSS
jgi:hypothetical protein